jgi:hypothetical protein
VVLDGSGADGHAPVSRALDVDRGRLGMRAVTIRACTFIGYAQGLLLTGPNISDADPARALRRFVVEDTSVIDVGGVGVYVGPRSEDFVIERLVVRNARLTGLYLDAYSRRTRVADSRFEHNGYSRCSLGREGIAIDASSENVIERSVFIDNRLAGIAIYKNCGESGVPREQPASFNYIARNTFAAHCSAGGGAVVIASRQGVDIVADDCLADECLDPPMLDGRRRDHAPFNTVVFNRFLDNDTAVLVQDSHARVVGNSVAGAGCTGESTRAHIVVGSEFLSRVGAPVRDVSVLLNDATGDRPLLQFVDGSEEIDVGPRVSDGAGPAVAPGTRPVAD